MARRYEARPDRTTAAAWTRAIVRALEARGIDGSAVAAAAGVRMPGAADPHARVAMPANAELWRRAVDATADPAFGLAVSRCLSPAAFPPLGALVLASGTLREAFEHVAARSHLIADGFRIGLEAHGDRLRIVFSSRGGAAPEALDACLSLAVRLARLLHERRELAPLRVEMQRPEPLRADRLRGIFRRPGRLRQAAQRGRARPPRRRRAVAQRRSRDRPRPGGGAGAGQRSASWRRTGGAGSRRPRRGTRRWPAGAGRHRPRPRGQSTHAAAAARRARSLVPAPSR